MIEAWVTRPDGTYLAHLDRSAHNPFRHFQWSRVRRQSGTGSLEYHRNAELLTEVPDLFADDNLVHVKYRGVTTTWIIESRTVVLDENEQATDWYKVQGRGVRQLLGDRVVFPPAFNNGANLNPVTWGEGNQWRTFTNRAAGEMLWDLISDSSSRFATQITRGDIDVTGSDGWTQNLRFDNLLSDVIASVEAVHGEVVMDGLIFNYYHPLGHDRRNEVIFEEGADLLRVVRDQETTGELTWIVAEGMGEGVFAKLRLASKSAGRRREGFLDAKDADNLTLLQAKATGALSEHNKRDSVAIEVDERRHRALIDYDIGDTVRVIAPSRDVDEAIRIEALYFAETDDDRVRVRIDLSDLSRDELSRIAAQQRSMRSSIGVRSRQPQGQLVPYPIVGSGTFDSGEPLVVDFRVPESIFVLVRTVVQFSFSEFWAPARAAEEGGGSTSGSSSASTSTSGGSATPTTSSQAAHQHKMFEGDFAAGAATKRLFAAVDGGGTDYGVNIEVVTNSGDMFTKSADGSHDHTVTVPGHTHGIAHTHTTPNHAHDLDYGIFKEAMPGSISVVVGIYRRVGSNWTLVTSISGLTDEIEDVDLTPWVDTAGSWRLSIQSASGAPQGGRLAVSVAGSIEGAIQSA